MKRYYYNAVFSFVKEKSRKNQKNCDFSVKKWVFGVIFGFQSDFKKL